MQCDVCGGLCLDALGIKDEYGTLHASWGYGSERDLQDHECRICEKCYGIIEEFIKKLGGKIRVMDARDALLSSLYTQIGLSAEE